MALKTAVPWQDVLDEVDDGTAILILKLQLEELEEHNPTTDISKQGHKTDDFKYATAFLRNDLEIYRSTRWYDKDEPEVVEQAFSPVVLFVCIICEESYDGDHVSQVPCEHHFCDGCFNELFRIAMTHEDAYPPRCCRQAVEFDEVRAFLDKDLSAQFAMKKEELDDTRRIYCHDPKCSAYIGQEGRAGKQATCSKCSLVTCRLCKQAAHEGECEKDAAIEETLQLAESEGWRRCYSCERMVELRTGCNHMT
jgi:hypothetical protein